MAPKGWRFDTKWLETRESGVEKDEVYAMGETIACGTYASARGLAKLGRYMANGGAFDGHRLMSEEAWADMHSEPKMSAELGPVFSTYTKGGVYKWNPV